MDDDRGADVTAATVAAFLGELALRAVVAVAGARLGDGATSWVLAIVLPLVLVVLWGLMLAPRSSHRLRHPPRLLAQVGLVLVAALLLAASGLGWWAAVVFVFVGGVFSVAELQAARRARDAGASRPDRRPQWLSTAPRLTSTPRVVR